MAMSVGEVRRAVEYSRGKQQWMTGGKHGEP